jgi:hypothetical protein
MNSRLCVLLGLVVQVVAFPISAWGETAGELYSACKPIAEAKMSDKGILLRKDFETGLCWGAFASLQQVGRWYDSAGPVMGVCVPAESTRSELIAVFVNYVQNHPEHRHDDFVDVAISAFHGVYPCKPK